MSDSELVLQDVTVRFGGNTALDAVTLTADAPVTGIVGPNGAGKTTLLNVVAGFVRPQAGRVRLGERELGGLAPHRRARAGVGRTFQHPVLVPMLTVAESLRLAARRGGGEAMIWRRRFGEATTSRRRDGDAMIPRRREGDGMTVDEVIDLLNLGPWLDRDAHVLPYGVRKAVDIGRALVGGPRVLLCDEPLSGLDDPARDSTVQVLKTVAGRGVRLVVIEHDLARIAALAQCLVVLDAGQVVISGEPDQVLADERVRAAYTGTL